ncbi:MAG: hypothetical protein DRI90_28360, partial [Deltaproteobacteria bacterium]
MMLGLGDESFRSPVAPYCIPWVVLGALLVLGCASAPIGEGRAAPTDSGDQVTPAIPQPAGESAAPSVLVSAAVRQAKAAPRTQRPSPNPDASSHRRRQSPATRPLLGRRPYQLLRPHALAAGARHPLFIYLHGLGASGRRLLSALDLAAFADRKQVFIVAPDGTRDSRGRRFWNASGACCDFDRSGVDDVAYLTALIDDVRARQPVDPKRIYVVGYSNGGFMAHRLACELSDRIAGIASFSGAAYDATECTAEPVTVLQVHGDRDR